MAASYPHFYDAHPDYLQGVIGLNPSKEKHGLAMILEPVSKIQYNKINTLRWGFSVTVGVTL